MVVPVQLWVLRERRPIPELEAAPRTLATDTLVRTASCMAATPWVYSSAGLAPAGRTKGEQGWASRSNLSSAPAVTRRWSKASTPRRSSKARSSQGMEVRLGRFPRTTVPGITRKRSRTSPTWRRSAVDCLVTAATPDPGPHRSRQVAGAAAAVVLGVDHRDLGLVAPQAAFQARRAVHARSHRQRSRSGSVPRSPRLGPLSNLERPQDDSSSRRNVLDTCTPRRFRMSQAGYATACSGWPETKTLHSGARTSPRPIVRDLVRPSPSLPAPSWPTPSSA